jgi:hypothetical protein
VTRARGSHVGYQNVASDVVTVEILRRPHTRRWVPVKGAPTAATTPTPRTRTSGTATPGRSLRPVCRPELVECAATLETV